MAYNLEPVDGSELADGHRWMFVVEPDGEMHFVCDRDGPTVFPADFLCKVLHLIEEKASALVG